MNRSASVATARAVSTCAISSARIRTGCSCAACFYPALPPHRLRRLTELAGPAVRARSIASWRCGWTSQRDATLGAPASSRLAPSAGSSESISPLHLQPRPNAHMRANSHARHCPGRSARLAAGYCKAKQFLTRRRSSPCSSRIQSGSARATPACPWNSGCVSGSWDCGLQEIRRAGRRRAQRSTPGRCPAPARGRANTPTLQESGLDHFSSRSLLLLTQQQR